MNDSPKGAKAGSCEGIAADKRDVLAISAVGRDVDTAFTISERTHIAREPDVLQMLEVQKRQVGTWRLEKVALRRCMEVESILAELYGEHFLADFLTGCSQCWISTLESCEGMAGADALRWTIDGRCDRLLLADSERIYRVAQLARELEQATVWLRRCLRRGCRHCKWLYRVEHSRVSSALKQVPVVVLDGAVRASCGFGVKTEFILAVGNCRAQWRKN